MKIQISLSTRCNIHCKFCLKEVMERKYGFVENINMPVNLFHKIVDDECNFKAMHLCSNRGEALVHPQITDILKYGKKKNKRIEFVTNASFKNTSWWSELANIFDERDCVIFPLDGVGNKSHNKHRGSDFYTVLRNIEAYINAGGHAIWRYIIFEHNQHQVELARKLSENIGSNFISMFSHTYDNELRKPNIERKLNNKIYFPCDNKNYYVNVKGQLFPCCFMANIYGNEPLRINHYEKKLIAIYEKEEEMLNIKNNDIQYIADHSEFFKEAMKKYSNVCKGSCYNWSKNQL